MSEWPPAEPETVTPWQRFVSRALLRVLAFGFKALLQLDRYVTRRQMRGKSTEAAEETDY